MCFVAEKEKRHSMKLIEGKLKRRGYKLTPQRRATLEVLINNQSKHLSTEDVYDLAKGKTPNVGLATIYRTLQLFNDFNIIKKLNFNDGCYRYELNKDQRHQHHHLICVKCGKVYEFDDNLLEGLQEKINKDNNFTVKDHMIKFYGYCKKCYDVESSLYQEPD